jgi:hypothetical protein
MSDEQQKRFEAWYKSEYDADGIDLDQNDDDSYETYITQVAWEAFQEAARQAMEELSQPGTLRAAAVGLSWQVAAVVAALVKTHRIAADRLEVQGVGPFSPVRSNAGEAGRTRNRRVELVLR